MLVPAIVISSYIIFVCLSQAENFCEAPKKSRTRVAALVPARAGSKGIKDKNLSKLGNETLLSRTLKVVKACGSFDSVWVSTDGEAIAETAAKEGANVHWRHPETGKDNASTVSVVEDFLERHKEYDIIGVIQCTSPFLKEAFLIRALNLMIKTNSSCVFSVIRSHQLRWIENDDKFVTPLNFDPKKRPRRQDWKGELVETGMFYFVKPELVLREKALQNDRCKTIEVSKFFSLEIDTLFDLIQARALLPIFDNHTET